MKIVFANIRNHLVVVTLMPIGLFSFSFFFDIHLQLDIDKLQKRECIFGAKHNV